MPSFDVTSEVDMQEVRNAVDQAGREVANRYDFRDTGSRIELGDDEITLVPSSEDRLTALWAVLEERLVKRKVSLKAVSFGEIEEASGMTVRQVAALNAGISKDKGRELNKSIKDLKLKGVQSEVQGVQLRVTGKKRDHLQDVIASLKAEDFGVPLQYGNFREKQDTLRDEDLHLVATLGQQLLGDDALKPVAGALTDELAHTTGDTVHHE